MRSLSLAAAALLAIVALSGCGGSSKPVPGQSLAAEACKGGGATAATEAAQAAQLNPKFATLAADEAAEAGTQATENEELSDPADGSAGSTSDDGGLSNVLSVGTSGSDKVLTDCVTLGLSVIPSSK